MRKLIPALFILSIIFISADAQEKRINLYGAYVFDDEIGSTYDSYNYFQSKVIGGFQYGAGLEILPRGDMGVELLWMGQNTTAPTYYASSSYYGFYQEKYAVLELNNNFAMIGFNGYNYSPSSKIETYGGLMLGALFASAKNPDTQVSDTKTKFAWGVRAGANVWTSGRVGLKFQAQLLSAVQSVGGSLYFGTGGAGAGVSTYSSMLQFSLGGGLSFTLGKNEKK